MTNQFVFIEQLSLDQLNEMIAANAQRMENTFREYELLTGQKVTDHYVGSTALASLKIQKDLIARRQELENELAGGAPVLGEGWL